MQTFCNAKCRNKASRSELPMSSQHRSYVCFYLKLHKVVAMENVDCIGISDLNAMFVST